MEKYEHKYGAEQIQVLEGLEAVRKRPGMYIGSTSVRGLHHMVYEIVDNCVDEALAGYCTEINIVIEPGNIMSVEDNGRGIPVEIHPKTHISTAETVYTVLHAGGKFGGDSGYKVSGGLHGVGASVVNALSNWVEVTIQRDGGIYQMKFEKGKTVKKLEKIGNSKKTGTKVRFLADDTIFETQEFDYDVLETRFREMAFLTKGLKITFEDKRNPEKQKKVEFCFEGGLKSFVEFLNKNKECLHKDPIYIEKDGEVPVEIAMQYTTSYSENIYTFVNNINTIEGGTHLEGFKRSLTKVFNDYARSHNILKDKDSVEKFTTEIKEKGLSEYYTLNTNVEELESATKSIENVKTFATTFLLIMLAISAVVLFVINMINIRERKYEIGVFRTIGVSKFKLTLQFALEILIVSVVMLGIGAVCGSFLAKPVGNMLLENEIQSVQEETEQISNNFGKGGPMDMNFGGTVNVQTIDTINAVVDITVVAQLLGIGLALMLVSSLASMISIQRFSPLTILKERS